MLIKDDIPTLLSLRGMITNGLDLSIGHGHACFNERIQKLDLVNVFMEHNWEPKYMRYVLFTETELRAIHRNFGHPSFRAM